jgi:polar amino acid transport system ATP-binding protein
MANVRLVELTKRYKKGNEVIHALDGVTLDIDKGEFVAVVGRSGSGKTTMLDLMGLLLRPTSGSLFIDDIDTGKLGDRELARVRAHRIGFVFQEYNLLSGLNVLENVMLPLRYVKDGKNGRSRAVELVERVGLSDRQRHRPTELSGGQAQRVAIARALAMEPEVMLFDEVTSALDPELVGEVLEVMRKLAEDGTTMIVVTHEISFARDIADHVLFMDGGQVAEHGPAAEVLVRPSNPRTRAFLSRFHGTAAAVRAAG